MIEQFLQETVRAAGVMAKEYFVRGVTARTKTHLGDLVTDADMAVNDFLIEKIREKFPDHGIHTEEEKADTNPGAVTEWIIDPIDGTRNFANGIPLWCIMMAVHVGGEGEHAAIYNPVAGELFYASRGRGAYLNGVPIRVNGVTSFEHGYGLVVRDGQGVVRGADFNRFLTYLVNDTSVWLLNPGSMLAAGYVASGGLDFFVENGAFDHDYAAPAVILSEAGALVTDADGHPWRRGRRDFIAANPEMHKKIMKFFQK